VGPLGGTFCVQRSVGEWATSIASSSRPMAAEGATRWPFEVLSRTSSWDRTEGLEQLAAAVRRDGGDGPIFDITLSTPLPQALM